MIFKVRWFNWNLIWSSHVINVYQNSFYYIDYILHFNWINKKVLLHERKRHTTCRVASTRYAALVGVGVSLLGYPPSAGWGSWMGVPPISWRGVPSCLDQGRGYPPGQLDGVPPPVEVWTDTQSENINSCHPSDAGGNYWKNGIKLTPNNSTNN